MATESLVVEILGGAAGFMTILFGGFKLIIDSTNKSLHNKIDTFKSQTSKTLEETSEDIVKIFETLKIVDDTIAKDNVSTSLRGIIRAYIYYNKGLSNNAKIIIDAQASAIIDIVQNVISEKFNEELLDLTSAKLEAISIRINEKIKNFYGEDSLMYFIPFQFSEVEEYKDKLYQLSIDSIVNSKYTRFKSITESFLHNIITGTLHFIHKWESSHKNWKDVDDYKEGEEDEEEDELPKTPGKK